MTTSPIRDALTALDDTLCHQTPLTFDQAGVTDHRFMDRYWYTLVAPDRSIGMVTGLGAYPNMNVFDGYCTVVVDRTRQINLRVSRTLRPRRDEIGSGPIGYENLIPHQRNRLVVGENDGPIRMDVTFEAHEPPRLEAPHRSFQDGILLEDYRRLHQGGTARGTISVGDRSWDVEDWYAAKDHSWGVRGHFGGATIIRGGPPVDDFSGLFVWAGFTAGKYDGYVQLKEDGGADAAGRRYADGEVLVAADDVQRPVRIVSVEHDIAFTAGSNIYTNMRFDLAGDTGETFRVEIQPAHLPVSMMGTGYFDGFDDRRGFGAFRGEDVVEHDEYELFDDGFVRYPNGKRGRPWHREAPSVAQCNGEEGFGYSCALVEGKVARYGLDLPKRSRQGNGVTWEDGSPDDAPGRSQGEHAGLPADGVVGAQR